MNNASWQGLLGPQLAAVSGHLTLSRAKVSRDGQRLLVCFTSDQLIDEKDFLSVKRALQAGFPECRVSLRITSPQLAEDFRRAPDKYGAVLAGCIGRHSPSLRPWLSQVRWTMRDGALCVVLPIAAALPYFERNDTAAFLSRIVRDVFAIDVPVRLEVSGDQERQIADLLEERRKEEELLAREAAQSVAQQKAEKPKQRPKNVYGRAIADPAVEIRELLEDSGKVVLCGEVLTAETKELKGGEMLLLTFALTDYTGTIQCKAFLRYKNRFRKQEEGKEPTEQEKKAVQDVVDAVKPGEWLLVRGECQFDKFLHETSVMVNDINLHDKPRRVDTAPRKRVELHLHTQMSSMDAVSSASALIGRAAEWGHPAVAVTDHGVVQAYPEAFGAAKKKGIKLIPGVEAYLTDETTVVTDADGRSIDDPIVVLDFETTGLNPRRDRVIEIGAVRIQNGQVVEEFSQMVNPGTSIPAKIVELTGINDSMVRDAPTADTAIPQLLEFIGGAAIAAHNATFDASFLREECKRLGLTFQRPVIDTLEFSRRMYPSLKSHRLGAVCKSLGISLKNAHRAVHDARATAHMLNKMFFSAREKGVEKLSDINGALQGGAIGESYHIILLAESQKGIENINRMVSEAHLHYFHRVPHTPRSLIQKYREGVIVGSACEAGELFRAIVDGKNDTELSRIARFYDYLEIQPIGNNAFMLRNGTAESEEALRDFNRKIVSLGEKLGIPVVATGDVHFMDPKDAIFRAILMAGKGFEDADEQPPLYFKTTDEMLEEFAYLGPEKCEEVVIDNPLKIAARVGDVNLFPRHPEGKETFQPFWPDAADNIRNMSYQQAHEWYGDPLPELVEARIEKELKAIIGYGFATLYNIAEKLVKKSNADGYLVGSRGSVGSSFVAHLVGITEVNALPPHYRCPQCKYVNFDVDKAKYKVGVDLPEMNCPVCSAPLTRDGYEIPFEVFLGFKGDKVPDIDLNFSGVYQPRAHAYIEELFGKSQCFRAGTIGTLAEKTAYGFVSKYCEERGLHVTEAEKNRLVQGCVGVKRTTGQHPAGMVVLPKEYTIYQFTAIQHPADDVNSSVITTHYDFGSMHDVLVKLDVLGHDDPTMIRMLMDLTGIDARTLPLTDPKVISLFSSPEALGVTPEQIHSKTGTYGVPEFGTRFVRQMLEETHPTTMNELLSISGLSHGTDVWIGNAQELIHQGVALADCICTREDIMNGLIAIGVDSKMAFDTMESVRKGKGLKPEMEQAMIERHVPDWFMDSCKKIKYMFPKGHAVAYVTMALRIAWFKVYRPEAYYAAFFTVRADCFDASVLAGSIESIEEHMKQIDAMKDATAKDKDMYTLLELVLEMNYRGIRFAPVDLYKSQAAQFEVVEKGVIRMPFNALPGVGAAAAQGIVDARADGPFISVEEFKERTRLSTSAIDLLRECGCLSGLPETNQVSLFTM